MEAAQKTVKERKEYVVGIDLERFFDRIHHDRLINQMKLQISDKRILRLTGMLLRSEIMKDGLVRAMRVLCKQVHLARLSNVVLDELDKELEQSWTGVLPWADDANIFVRTSKAAERVMGIVSKFIENRLKLKINRREK